MDVIKIRSGPKFNSNAINIYKAISAGLLFFLPGCMAFNGVTSTVGLNANEVYVWSSLSSLRSLWQQGVIKLIGNAGTCIQLSFVMSDFMSPR